MAIYKLPGVDIRNNANRKCKLEFRHRKKSMIDGCHSKLHNSGARGSTDSNNN